MNSQTLFSAYPVNVDETKKEKNVGFGVYLRLLRTNAAAATTAMMATAAIPT